MKNKVLILVILILLLPASIVLASSKVTIKRVELVQKGRAGERILNYPGLPAMGYNISALDGEYFYVYDSQGKFPFYALEKKHLN